MRLIGPSEIGQLKGRELPTHVGLIMDGNGRWASYRGLARTEGHYAAWTAAANSIRAALDFGIPWLTLYAFSSENWKRPSGDLRELFNIKRWRAGQRDFLHLAGSGVRFQIAGNLDEPRIPSDVANWLRELEDRSRGGHLTTVTVVFNQGGQDDILQAARAIARDGIGPMTAEAFRKYLSAPDAPDIDLLIRTGGEFRISNFQIWRLAYAELLFTDTLFPDFTQGHFASALADYSGRHRRFGNVTL